MNQDSEFDQLLFFFERHRDIELEDGYVLAGILIVDLPTPDHMTAEALDKSRKMTSEIIMHLSRMAADGQMPDDAQIFGWKDGKDRPDETTDDDELLHAWAHNKLCLGVRTNKDGILHTPWGSLRPASALKTTNAAD